MKLIGDADADWSGDLDDRKSTTGYYFKFEGNGAAISWEVKKQATVALSSTEAEYQAMAAAVQEAIYLRSVMKDFGYPVKEPTQIGEDNQSCIKMCHNPVMHKRSKHIDTKLHFIRERVENGEVGIHYIPTDDMTADILTKSLHVLKLKNIVVFYWVTELTEHENRLIIVTTNLSLSGGVDILEYSSINWYIY